MIRRERDDAGNAIRDRFVQLAIDLRDETRLSFLYKINQDLTPEQKRL